MPILRDLTPYEYLSFKPRPNVVSVGWLDKLQAYQTAQASPDFLGALFELTRAPVRLCRGSHTCTLCHAGDIHTEQGNGELWVHDIDGLIYVAPILIWHYVRVHDYHPPRGFIDAVLAKNIVDPEKAFPWRPPHEPCINY